MDSDLSLQDKKDLDKFIKFFALKTVQVIVQARLGEKICTRSSSSPTGSDWFNLAIKDIPEVTHEAKKALAGQLPGVGHSMCVEISLKTSEGDSMELETWCLEMNEKCDKDIKVSYTVYNRLSVLLKSLLAITRVTPAYKLSRKQGHDYVILYRIYFGEVQMNGFGEGFQTVRVGVVGTPVGTITLSCAYRTNLAFMSNRQFERSAPIMGIIVDHFVDPPCGGQRAANMGQPCNYRPPDDDDDGVQFSGVQDSQEVCTTSFSTSPPSQCVCTLSPSPSKLSKALPLDSPQIPLVPGLVTHTLYASRLCYQPPGTPDLCRTAANPNQTLHAGKEDGVVLHPAKPHRGADAHLTVETIGNTTGSSGDDDILSHPGEGRRSASPSDPLQSLNAFTRKVGAFVNKPNAQLTAAMDLPFAAFVPRGLDPEDNDPMVHPPDSPTCMSPLQASLHSQDSEGSAQHDDFVMVDFRPAFSKDDLLPMDLGTFYREFQNPPQLASLSLHISSQSMADDLDSLPEKLAIYEKNIDEFDAFVDMLQ
ncbi:autophagy-related protein 13 isoform X1 [Nerophis ophidion]|uniref:autophagy-related protein 13 isoform X1 n=1 Tax=Nerophis ophidion TaxID=159077 RepID=UPI002ADFE203|nr:autophagy-related protein 13 isoform X1 [Nerophis ophidion]XP_061745562.1 autophagy-related protein 13 isoform X1 [Nerophis ophidion]XP_061745563.1 autophagy-related protein 13 isoform X1 [Nerophis ophidion]